MSDYISREEAEKRIDEALSRVFVEPVGKSILSKLPAANVKPVRWIPVEEQLPENEQDTLCCFDDGFMATATYMDEYKDWELWQDAGNVTHWMPLPEPPKQEEG